VAAITIASTRDARRYSSATPRAHAGRLPSHLAHLRRTTATFVYLPCDRHALRAGSPFWPAKPDRRTDTCYCRACLSSRGRAVVTRLTLRLRHTTRRAYHTPLRAGVPERAAGCFCAAVGLPVRISILDLIIAITDVGILDYVPVFIHSFKRVVRHSIHYR